MIFVSKGRPPQPLLPLWRRVRMRFHVYKGRLVDEYLLRRAEIGNVLCWRFGTMVSLAYPRHHGPEIAILRHEGPLYVWTLDADVDDWLRQHCTGWWGVRPLTGTGLMINLASLTLDVWFSNPNDAFAFKMRWG